MEEALDKSQTHRLILHLRLDALPGLFNLVSLLGGSRKHSNPSAINDASADATPAEEKTQTFPGRPFEVRGVRLMELTDRTSSVMASAEVDEFASRDAVFSAFQTFSRLNGVAVAGQVSIIPTSAYAETIVKYAEEARSDFMIIPWSTYGGIAEESSTAALTETGNTNDRFFSRTYIDYVQAAVERSTCATGIFINRIPHDDLARKPTLTRTRTGLSIHSANDGAVVQRPVDQRQIILVARTTVLLSYLLSSSLTTLMSPFTSSTCISAKTTWHSTPLRTATLPRVTTLERTQSASLPRATWTS